MLRTWLVRTVYRPSSEALKYWRSALNFNRFPQDLDEDEELEDDEEQDGEDEVEGEEEDGAGEEEE